MRLCIIIDTFLDLSREFLRPLQLNNEPFIVKHRKSSPLDLGLALGDVLIKCVEYFVLVL